MKKTLITFCLLLAGVFCCLGQLPTLAGKGIAELSAELQQTRTDTTRLRLLHAKGDHYLKAYYNNGFETKSLDTALQCFNAALKISLRIHADTGYGRYPSMLRIGEVWMRKGDTTRGLHNLRQVVKFYNDGHDQAEEANSLHLLYKCVAAFDKNAAIKGFQQVLALRRKLKENDLAISAGFNVVVLNFQQGNFNAAEKVCSALIDEFKNTKCTRLDMLYTFSATIFRYQGNLEKALQRTMDAIKWINTTQGEIALDKASQLYGELGLIYQELGQTANSIIWYKKTIEVREKLSINQEHIYRTAGFLVQGLIKENRTEEGLKYLAALIKRKPPLNDLEKGVIAQIKAYCYDALKRYQLADQYFKLMLKLYPLSTDDELMMQAKFDVAEFYVRQKKFKEADLLVTNQLKSFKSLARTKDLYLLLFKIDSAQGRMDKAIQNYQTYKALNDSIFNATKSKQIEELEIKYATEQKENDIKSLRKDGLLQNEQIKQANYTRNITLIGVGLLLIVVGLLYNSYRINQKKSKEIDIKNASLNQLLTEKDNLLLEKEWLIKEVHHRVKNNLQIVMGLLQRQSSFINNKVALAAIQNSEHRMHSIALIHQKLYQSENFKLVNMVDYITEMIGYLQESFDLGSRITFEKQIDDIDFEIATAVPLGLILNEAITNAIKYAFPTYEKGCIRVTLNQTGEETYALRIADDGRGLPVDFDIMRTNSMGFNLIRGLSKQLGGKVDIEDMPGTAIIVHFKIEQH